MNILIISYVFIFFFNSKKFNLMVDILNKNHRSWNMRQIKSSNTKPEIIVRSFLHREGLRFRLHIKRLPGKPDIVLKKYKTAIFVDGCFWHRHFGCSLAYNPKSRQQFWQSKFNQNIERDKKVNKQYDEITWNQIRIWQCEINDEYLRKLANTIKKV
jgi:DNA mismatch endonuclease, patch repair protein